MLLTEFFSRHGGLSKEEFLEAFGGAFLLGRREKAAPYLLHVSKDTEKLVVIGSDEDVEFDFDDPTLDPRHAVVVFHEGFNGWTIEDKATSFGTHVDGDRVQAERPVLMRDRSTIKAGGMTQLQFYLSETLYARMSKAGITRSMRSKSAKHSRLKSKAKEAEALEAKVQAEVNAKAAAAVKAKAAAAVKAKADAEKPTDEDAALVAELDALAENAPTQKVEESVLQDGEDPEKAEKSKADDDFDLVAEFDASAKVDKEDESSSP